MSIKLLHPSARALLQSRLDDYERVLAKGIRVLAMPSHKKIVCRVPNDFSASVEAIRQARDECARILGERKAWADSLTTPIPFVIPFEATPNFFKKKVIGTIFLYKGAFYAVAGPYNVEEAKLTLLESLDRRKRKAEYLVSRKDVVPIVYQREPIPELVRHEVWRRDMGRCVKCGSVQKLEFDHIIPVSLGGANTARNLQLLCEPCNRMKSNQIG
jgi:5-methylcytosine-specific restriction endonuclease McrA